MMRWEHVHAVDEARATLRTATEFGLREDEIWGAMVEAWQRMCAEDFDDPNDLLTAALASRILERERRH